ncbi:MAG: methyl-accepting chemotaxis protein [Sphingobium sp.]|nr:methyl-accepting chemotaxis protein [Sphingobium sp.]
MSCCNREGIGVTKLDRVSESGNNSAENRVLADLGERSGDMALQCSDAAGFISTLNQRIQVGAQRLVELQDSMALLAANQAESNAADNALQRTAAQAQSVIAQGNAIMAASLDDFSALVDHVTGLEEKLRHFLDIIGAVGSISEELGAIARQTRMLGVNAAVEAARGGEATKGFAIVAQEIRHLANRATDSTESVTDQLGDLGSSARELISAVESSISMGRETGGQIDRLRDAVGQISVLVTEFQSGSAAIARCNDEGARKVTMLGEGFAQFCIDASKNAREAQTAHDRLDRLETQANGMLNRIAHQAVATRNSPFITMALEGAAEVSLLIGDALESGRLSTVDLFDTAYDPIPGTDPVQYMTRFVPYADAVLRPLFDRHSARDKAVVGCCLVDMNGFLPTHISERSQPQQTGNRAWNVEYCRNRQIFMDSQTRHALDDDGDYFLYTYRQDLGEGRYRALRSVLVPMHFAGRRWGLYELGYLI